MKRSVTLIVAATATVFGIVALAPAQPANGPTNARDFLERADANNDGVITRAEFDAVRGARFLAIDADHNGVLSAAEREANAPSGRMAARFNPDTSNDGSVSRAEFDAQGSAMFARFDRNQDGRLSSDELPNRR